MMHAAAALLHIIFQKRWQERCAVLALGDSIVDPLMMFLEEEF